jgi:hypothetical protein
MSRYPTLDEINMSWVPVLGVAGPVVLVASVILGLLLAMFRSGLLGPTFGVGLALSLGLALAHGYVFYNHVTCPGCGGKLNKFKNGKNVPMKQAHKQLANGYGCRHCGWRPKRGDGA